MTELDIGMKAPDFCLPDIDEHMVCIAEQRGVYVVIYFYPKDNSSGCTFEASSFSDAMEEFARDNTPVFGISPDSIESHRRFAEKQKLTVSPPLRSRAHGDRGIWRLEAEEDVRQGVYGG